MNNIVITSYGKDKKIKQIAVSVFDTSDRSWYGDETDAATYCRMTNSLETKQDPWICAKTASENTPYDLSDFLPLPDFSISILAQFDGKELEQIFWQDKNELIGKALSNATQEIIKKVMSKISEGRAESLKEALKNPVTEEEAKKAQIKVLEDIRYLLSIRKINLINTEEK
jgi:hypothetical protein